VLALGVVVLGSVLAAVSNSFVLLVVGRGLQGGPRPPAVTMAIARSHLPTEKAARTIATLSITTPSGIGLGYPITSAITELFNTTPPSVRRVRHRLRARPRGLVVPPNPGRTTVGST